MSSLSSLCQSDCNHQPRSPLCIHTACLSLQRTPWRSSVLNLDFFFFTLLGNGSRTCSSPGPTHYPCIAIHTNAHPGPFLNQGATVRNGHNPALQSACASWMRDLGGQGRADMEKQCLLRWQAPLPLNFLHYHGSLLCNAGFPT